MLDGPDLGVDGALQGRGDHPREPSDGRAGAGRAVLAAVPARLRRPLLYARVDLIPGPDGDPMLVELELTEPSLFLEHAEGAADRLAAAIASPGSDRLSSPCRVGVTASCGARVGGGSRRGRGAAGATARVAAR